MALSTCFGGFRGLLQINNIVYEIKPMIFSTKFEHLVYRMDSKETQFPTMKSDAIQEEIVHQSEFQEIGSSTLEQSAYEGWWVHNFLIETAVVVDHSLYVHWGKNVSNLQENLYIVIIYYIIKTPILIITLVGSSSLFQQSPDTFSGKPWLSWMNYNDSNQKALPTKLKSRGPTH